MCDFVGCTKEIRDSDKGFAPETAKFCEEHGVIVDALLDGNPVKLFQWYAKNVFPKGVTMTTDEKIAAIDELQAKVKQQLRDVAELKSRITTLAPDVCQECGETETIDPYNDGVVICTFCGTRR